MMWLLLILALAVALPLLAERNRRVMDDTARGVGRGQYATLPQGVTHYEWVGPTDGPVLVCRHGLSTPSFVWRGLGLVPGLVATGFRVLTYDLYGRGYSDRPKGHQNAAFFTRQLTDLLTHQHVKGPVTLLGYSMGGAIAASFAAADPDRVRRLILIAPAGMDHSIGPMVKFVRDTPVLGDLLMLAAYPRMMRQGLAAERDMPSSVLNITDLQEAELEVKGFTPAVLSSLRGILSKPLKRAHHRLRDAGLPILAIWGEVDATIPLTALGTLTEWHRDVRHEVIPGAGHALPYTHTQDMQTAIEGWISRTNLVDEFD